MTGIISAIPSPTVAGYNVLAGDPVSNKIQEGIWRKVDQGNGGPSPIAVMTTPSLLTDRLKHSSGG